MQSPCATRPCRQVQCLVAGVICPFVSLCAAMGLVGASRLLWTGLARMAFLGRWRKLTFAGMMGCGILAVGLSLPWSQIRVAYELSPDSRNVAVAWMTANIPEGSILLVPRELEMDTRDLTSYKVVEYSLKRATRAAIDALLTRHEGAYAVIPRTGLSKWDSLFRRFANAGNRFGRTSVQVDSARPVRGGDPCFWIVAPFGGGQPD